MAAVDYVEPAYLKKLGDGWASGCVGTDAWTNTDNIGGDVFSPELRAMNIDRAWRRSNGAKVKVGLIDTGISGQQPELRMSGGFASGESVDRLLSEGTVGAASAECDHGTRMAGVIAAPKNGREAVGVAWKSDLFSYRHSDDVVLLDGWETATGIDLAVSGGSSVIAMAFQVQWNSDYLADVIRGYYASTQVLFVGAAGTSTVYMDPFIDEGNVVFPADMPQVFAVTGAKDIFYPDEKCDYCHFGKEVQLAAYIGLPTQGFTAGLVTNIKGSSVATAVVSGAAALIYSRYPGATREFVWQRLLSAGRLYPNRNNHVGYGVIDVWKAVGGMPSAAIMRTLVSGGGYNEVAVYDLTAVAQTALPRAADGPYEYQWGYGETTEVIRVTIGPGDPSREYTVTIRDTVDGTQRTATIVLDPPPGGCEDPTVIRC